MLATMQRILQKLTRSRGASAQTKVIAKPASVRRRRAWAQAVHQLVDRASRGRSGSQFPHPEWEAPLLLSTNYWRSRQHAWTLGNPSQPPPCSSSRRS